MTGYGPLPRPSCPGCGSADVILHFNRSRIHPEARRERPDGLPDAWSQGFDVRCQECGRAFACRTPCHPAIAETVEWREYDAEELRRFLESLYAELTGLLPAPAAPGWGTVVS